MQQKSIGDFDYSRPVDIIGYKPRTQGHSLQIRKAAEALGACKRPILCAGGGVFSAGAQGILRTLVEQVNLPTVSTMMGIGALPTAHPLNLGMLGSHGCAPANKAVRDADLVIMAGARVGTARLPLLVRLPPGPKSFISTSIRQRSAKTCRYISPLLVTFARCLRNSSAIPPESRRPMTGSKPLSSGDSGMPRSHSPGGGICGTQNLYAHSVRPNAGNGILCADVGQNQIWSANHFAVREGRFLTSGGMGTMGYSIPCALGAKSLARISRSAQLVEMAPSR